MNDSITELEELKSRIKRLENEIEFIWKYIEGDQAAIGARKAYKLMEGLYE